MSINKLTIPILALCILSVIVYTSCKKTKQPKTAQGIILGSWRLTQTGQDINGNGALESNEISTVDTNYQEVYTFNSDGTVTEHTVLSGTPTDITYFWQFAYSNRYLLLIPPGGDTISHYIEGLSLHSLEWKDTVSSTMPVNSWHFFTK